jgi:hypothetical protein
MNKPLYHPLSREQIAEMRASENAEVQRVWTRLRGALHSIIAMLSITHPRPLYWNDEFNRARVKHDPDCLRGTPFYELALQNVRAAEEIERMFHEHGHTAELHDTVDAYLDALLDEFEEMRLYPEIPPCRPGPEDHALSGQQRAAAGR